ncbi:MAG: hypothetical protein P8K82_01370 [Paracoccaceae bacterium]|nr:hypothetical protein [Paracoccaceae bacterium]
MSFGPARRSLTLETPQQCAPDMVHFTDTNPALPDATGVNE